MVQELLPIGLQGLVVAGLLAALMSTVAGALNSTATLVSIDIAQRLRPRTADHTLVRIGQATVVVVMIAATAWSTQGERFGGIFAGINHMIAVLAPPISTVFLWGVLWRRGTSTAALTTLVSGFFFGAILFVVDFPAVSDRGTSAFCSADTTEMTTSCHSMIPSALHAASSTPQWPTGATELLLEVATRRSGARLLYPFK